MNDVEDYSKQSYWESRYKEEPSYDWFPSRYAEILGILLAKIDAPNREKVKILHLGCGNSKLGVDLYEKGFKYVVNVDYSDTVINNMKEKYSSTMPEMTWETMDVRNLQFMDRYFDIVIDKAVMDTFQTDKASKTFDEDIENYLLESYRVLKKTGKFFQITWEIPCLRLQWTKIEKFNWEVEYEKIGEDDFYRIFTYTKN
jgi:ubiquinone/menaquinone biosynthesis C-methylase UbiE